MKLTLPIRPKVTAKASSSYTREQVEARIAALADRDDGQSVAERKYLETLMERKGWTR